MMEPIIKKVAEQNPNIKFETIMAEENPDLAAEYNIMAVPTFVVLEGNKELTRWSGFTPLPQFNERLQ